MSVYQFRMQMLVQSITSGDLYQGRSRNHKGRQYSVSFVEAMIFVEGERSYNHDRIDQLANFATDHGNTSAWMLVENVKL